MSLFGWLTGFDKYRGAQCALIAKHTFSQLTERDKDLVRITACEVLREGGIPPDKIVEYIDKMRESERYCLYAMAMAVVGIKPALKGVLYKDEWYHITNPFVALINAEKQIKIAQYEIKNKHNIHIDLADNNKVAANDDLVPKKRAIENYNDAIVYYNRGIDYSNLGQYQRAIEDYNQAIRLKPDYAEAYFNRGLAYDKLGQYQRAIEDFNEAIHLQPDDAEVYIGRGVAFGGLGQYQRAIVDYNEAIRLRPDLAGAYNNRGVVYFMQGNNELGCHDAQKACALGDCKLLEFAKGKGLCR